MKTILLVDDEPDVRSVLRMRLERNGYRVLESETGTQALEVVYTAHPDLLILDWTLHGLSGVEVLRTIRANQSTADLVVFMVTGMEESEIRQELHGLHVFASFTKPFNPGAILPKIDEALARIIYECRREAAETEACRGFSQVRATQADLRSVEETEREKPRQASGSAAVAGIHELSGLGGSTLKEQSASRVRTRRRSRMSLNTTLKVYTQVD